MRQCGSMEVLAITYCHYPMRKCFSQNYYNYGSFQTPACKKLLTLTNVHHFLMQRFTKSKTEFFFILVPKKIHSRSRMLSCCIVTGCSQAPPNKQPYAKSTVSADCAIREINSSVLEKKCLKSSFSTTLTVWKWTCFQDTRIFPLLYHYCHPSKRFQKQFPI